MVAKNTSTVLDGADVTAKETGEEGEEERDEDILKNLNLKIEIPPLTEPFVVERDLNPYLCRNLAFRFRNVGIDLMKSFGNQVIEPRAGFILSVHEVVQKVSDEDVIPLLGSGYEVDLAAIFYILSQPYERYSFLSRILHDLCASIFYAEGVNQNLYAIRVLHSDRLPHRQYREDKIFDLFSFSILNKAGWNKGTKIFSRKDP